MLKAVSHNWRILHGRKLVLRGFGQETREKLWSLHEMSTDVSQMNPVKTEP